MAVQLILKNSSVQDKHPNAAQLAKGEIALNFHESGPYLTCEDSAGTVKRIAGVTQSTNAPGSPLEGTFWWNTASDTLFIFAEGLWHSLAGGGGGGGGGDVDSLVGGDGIAVNPATGVGTVTASVDLDGSQDGLEFDGGKLKASIATAAELGSIRVGNGLAIDAGTGVLSTSGSGGATNLSIANRNANTLDVASSTGDNATIPSATTTEAGLMTAADKTALAATGNALVYKGTVDLTSSTTESPGSGDAGFTYANTGDGNASSEWAAISTLTTGTDTDPGDLVVWNGTQFTWIPTGGSGGGTATNLAASIVSNALVVTSSTGTDATLPRGTATDDGTYREPNNDAAGTTVDYVRRSVNVGGTQTHTWQTAPSGSAAQNLTYSPAANKGTVNIDGGGTDATIPLADATNAGLMTAAEKTAIANIQAPTATYNVLNSGDDGTLTLSPGGDTTIIDNVTTAANGLMLHDDKAKLDNVEANATAAQDLDYTAAVNQGTVTINKGGNNAVIPVADGTNAGLFTAAEKTKLAGIAAGATGNQNLSYTAAANKGTVNISDGTGTDIPVADGTNAGLFTAAEKTKLTGIAAGAEVNVQADYAQTDNTNDAFIQNKPWVITSNEISPATATDRIFASARIRGAVVATADTVAPDMQTANFFTYAGGFTLVNPTNEVAGTSGLFIITGYGAGSGFGDHYLWPGGGDAPAITAPAVVPYYVNAADQIYMGTPVQGIA